MTLRTTAAVILLTAVQARAQLSVIGGEVWTEVAPAKVKSILQGLQLEATQQDGEKSTVFTFQLATYKVHLDSHSEFMELQLALSDKVTVAAMNEWNRTHRFTRAYMDTDGGATLESDLDYSGGVTRATIEAFIKGFGDTIPGFTKVVLEAGKNSDAGKPSDRPPTATPVPSTQPSASSGILTLLDGRMSVRYDPAKWKQKPQTADATRFEFEHARGDGFALIIAEHANVPTDTIADIAFANMRKQDPTAKLTLKQKRRVGGVDIWFQTVDATIKGIPITYFGYYYGGQAGTVQLLTYTARSHAADFERDFLDFLNGFRVSY